MLNSVIKQAVFRIQPWSLNGEVDKRIDDAQLIVDDLAVLQVFRIQALALGHQRRSDDQVVVPGKP